MTMPRPAASGASPWRPSRVLKTLGPEQTGARKLAQRDGGELLCVRHRLSGDGEQGITTVALIVSVEPMRRRRSLDAEVALRLDFPDREHRAALQRAGARWDSAAKLWRLPCRLAIDLGVQAQIVE